MLLNPLPGDWLQVLPPSAGPTIVGLMRPKRRSWTTVLPILGLVAVIVALAILQFRWSGEVSEAERDRLQQSLQRSTAGFQAAFARDLFGICRSLQISRPGEPAAIEQQMMDRFAAWRRISGHAALVEGLYLLPRSGGPSASLLRFDIENRQLGPTAWPQSLEALRVHGHRALPKQPTRWLWDERIPALIHPVYATDAGTVGRPQLLGYLVVRFDAHQFEQVYLPNLAHRFFPSGSGFDFQLIENQKNGDRSVLYRSAKNVPPEAFPRADAVIPLLAADALATPGSNEIGSDGTGLNEAGSNGAAESTKVSNGAAALGPPSIVLASEPPQWWIALRHRSGSVETAVRSARHRDMAISAAVLLVLAISLLTLLIATRRARRLARLQMEFASGVSHELRTPLAVICSAAENLADGVVTGDSRVRDYGSMIHREGQRLTGLVDHILDFAALHSDARQYPLEPTSVAAVVEATLVESRPLADSAGVEIEVKVPKDLPKVMTDARTLGQCLQNLLTNAVKYGNTGGKIQVSAVERKDEPAAVSIAVRDFGTGIASEELPHIFDPFYRGATARTSRVRGTGLGLSLTREMIEALGGRITVESLPDEGSTFTLHVPVAASCPKANLA